MIALRQRPEGPRPAMRFRRDRTLALVLCGWMGGAEPGVTGPDDGRGPVGDLQLGQDVGHVVANRFLAEREPFGDSSVGPPGGDEVEDVVFAGGQAGEG